MRRLGLVGALAILSVVPTVHAGARPATEAGHGPYTIAAKSPYGLARLGPMRVSRTPNDEPPYQPRWTLEYAMEAFGPPRSREVTSGPGCRARWPGLGMTLTFHHVHRLPDGRRTVCRRPRLSHLMRARVSGDAARGRFETPRGTRIGTTERRLRRQYPNARESHDVWILVRTRVFGEWRTSLAARTRNGRVVSLTGTNHAD